MSDLKLSTFETNARTALHLGLGLIHTIREQAHELELRLQATYEELVTRGSAEQTGGAVQLRGIVDEGLERARDLAGTILKAD